MPQSETTFSWVNDSAFEFSLDEAGRFTGVTRLFGFGGSQFFRKR